MATVMRCLVEKEKHEGDQQKVSEDTYARNVDTITRQLFEKVSETLALGLNHRNRKWAA